MNEFVVRLNGSIKLVRLIDEKSIEVENVKYNYSFIKLNDSRHLLKLNNKFYETSFWKNSEEELSVQINNENLIVNIKTTLQEKAFQLISSSHITKDQVSIIKSPMPGLVLKILKKAGDNVSKGETVMILEAMKMENEIKVSNDGKVVDIFVSEGKPVEKYISLFSIK
ncbi:MAG TPA: hypothetical protein DHV28_16795 [Ignavibacteriales bacterium]|nr:hypothetical protein [Ignavibacteriales bacterium]